MAVYFNEFDPVAAHVLECLIKDKVIADGVVDRRSIADVDPADLAGFTQAHFFAGGGLWSVAARMAGWSDDRPLWTGSCPCQPFSVAGKGLGENDPRHLWPHFFRLIRACRPPVVVGEQVAGKAGYGWFDGVSSDLEGEGYASRAVDIPACSIDAPHIRSRLYWCAVQDMDNAAPVGRQPVSGERPSRLRAQGNGSSKLGCEPRYRNSRELLDMGDSFGAGLEGHAWDVHHGRQPGRVAQDASGSVAPAGRSDMADADGRGRSGWTQDPQRGAQRGDAAERACGDMADAESVPQREPDDDICAVSWEDARLGSGGRGGGYTPSDMADSNGSTRWQNPGSAFGDETTHGGAGRNRSEQDRYYGHSSDGEGIRRNGSFWSDYEWRSGADGKARRVGRTQPVVRGVVDGVPLDIHGQFHAGSGAIQETIPLLATGVTNRVSALRIMGNAIVPQLAAQVIAALMETQEIPR